MNKTFEVVKMGNPLLRETCKPVAGSVIMTEAFQLSLDTMIQTMREEDGAGIAAPQVGIRERFFSMEMKDNPRYPDKDSFLLCVAINPEITPIGTGLIDSWEGCLSIPGIRGKLQRHQKVELQALDRKGKKYTRQLTGFEAVVAQHELDHLNGILFIDRMESLETLSFQKEYEDFWL